MQKELLIFQDIGKLYMLVFYIYCINLIITKEHALWIPASQQKNLIEFLYQVFKFKVFYANQVLNSLYRACFIFN